MAKIRLFLSCLPGLEGLLEAEIADVLGSALDAPPRAEGGGVEVQGDALLADLSCLGLGLASHVLGRVTSFRVKDADDLAAHVARLPWSGWLRAGVPYRVSAFTKGSRALRHTGLIEERVRDAIAQRLGSAHDAGEGAPIPVAVRVVAERCTLSIDLGGDPLVRRGYRLEAGRAPLREDVARAAVLLSGWDQESPLVDPMCGSGTLAIEAALLSARVPPGHARRFALERMALFDPERHAQARAQLEARRRPQARVLASDVDGRQLALARRNAERAGVEVELAQCPLSEAPIPDDVGALVTNPPWGQRVGERDKLAKLHRALGRRVSSLPRTMAFALVCGDTRLARTVGFPIQSALLTESGGSKLRIMKRE